ncbi:MAG TPA: class I tRNA ligase family protein [Nitrososphaera sp.]|nr:class I tRNA ligase family protein [Nitrososphaera sp.]
MPDTTSTKSAVITSALPYANGEIHLGHIASTYLPADIFTRFLRLNGLKAYHICATDDFGTPILIRSEKEKKSPSDYVEYWNKHDKEDFESLGISFDFFSRLAPKKMLSLFSMFLNNYTKMVIFTTRM